MIDLKAEVELAKARRRDCIEPAVNRAKERVKSAVVSAIESGHLSIQVRLDGLLEEQVEEVERWVGEAGLKTNLNELTDTLTISGW